MITGYYSKDYLFDDLTSGIQRRLGILCFPKTLVKNPSVGSVFSSDHGLVASERLLKQKIF